MDYKRWQIHNLGDDLLPACADDSLGGYSASPVWDEVTCPACLAIGACGAQEHVAGLGRVCVKPAGHDGFHQSIGSWVWTVKP